MRGEARLLSPTAKKLEKFLDQKIDLTEDSVAENVDKIVEAQIKTLAIRALSLDYKLINWAGLVECATERQPPFEDGKSEKGFRDALILESYYQLADKFLPIPQTWVLLVSNDKLVEKAFEKRAIQKSTMRVLKSVDELTTLINSFRSEVAESFISSLIPQAMRLFFVKDDPNTLFYRASVSSLIKEKHAEVFSKAPLGFAPPTVAKVVVGQPKFISKARQRIRWSSKVRFAITAEPAESVSAFERSLVPKGAPAQDAEATIMKIEQGQADDTTSSETDAKSVAEAIFARLLKLPAMGRRGNHIFEVEWALTLTSTGKLTNAKYIDAHYVETIWES